MTYEVVASEGTPFYRLGPQQPAGPDLNLEEGRRVTMQEKRFGYSRVLLDNGWTGWLATDDVEAASDPVVVERPATLEENSAIVRRYRPDTPPVEDAPLPGGFGDVEEPAATDPVTEPVELPEFRY